MDPAAQLWLPKASDFSSQALQAQVTQLTWGKQRLQEQVRQLSTENTDLQYSCPNSLMGTTRVSLNQRCLLFLMHPQIYASDQAKMVSVISLLTGNVLHWVSPLLEGHSLVLSNWGAFLQSISTNFDDPHQV